MDNKKLAPSGACGSLVRRLLMGPKFFWVVDVSRRSAQVKFQVNLITGHIFPKPGCINLSLWIFKKFGYKLKVSPHFTHFSSLFQLPTPGRHATHQASVPEIPPRKSPTEATPTCSTTTTTTPPSQASMEARHSGPPRDPPLSEDYAQLDTKGHIPEAGAGDNAEHTA